MFVRHSPTPVLTKGKSMPITAFAASTSIESSQAPTGLNQNGFDHGDEQKFTSQIGAPRVIPGAPFQTNSEISYLPVGTVTQASDLSGA